MNSIAAHFYSYITPEWLAFRWLWVKFHWYAIPIYMGIVTAIGFAKGIIKSIRGSD